MLYYQNNIIIDTCSFCLNWGLMRLPYNIAKRFSYYNHNCAIVCISAEWVEYNALPYTSRFFTPIMSSILSFELYFQVLSLSVKVYIFSDQVNFDFFFVHKLMRLVFVLTLFKSIYFSLLNNKSREKSSRVY